MTTFQHTPSSRPGDRAQPLSVGLASIDKEHHQLIAQLNNLIDNAAALPDSDFFTEALSRLGNTLFAHFKSEEKIMRGLEMPADEVAWHVEAHDDILEQYAGLNVALMDGETIGRADTLRMMRGWIIDHVEQHDLSIGLYVR